MTDNNGKDRRRNFDGRINTLGTGTNGVSRHGAGKVGSNRSDVDDEDNSTEAPLADGEEPAAAESETTDEGTDELEADDEAHSDGVTPEADDATDGDDRLDTDEERSNGVTPNADVSSDDDDTEEEAADGTAHEERSENVDKRASLEVELDPFVRAYAARRAAEQGEESLDEYIVGSVKGYLAGLLGGDVSSPGTLKREVDVEADPIFGGLLESIAGDDQTVTEVVIDAVAEAYDVPVDEDSLVVAGLRDHEALLNGVVANSSNNLDDISEVVQAAVETRLIEEPA